ncbi:MAG: twin-arginine translocation pathway signal protein [Verrucomicrobia bacterium]|nr:twin-arginine translocation pathway signal protein [Verrucomicrobiota bacterium]
MSTNPTASLLPTTRREFLNLTGRGIGLLAFSRFAPAFLVNSAFASTPSPETGRPILVLIQLAGGNDGLNTLVPYEDANYFRLRPTIAIAKDKVLKLNETFGLHPSCAAMNGLFHDGKLAIVQNVGYPNPNRSHFRSSEIWETASGSNEFLGDGWIGRFMDNACAGQPADSHDPVGIHISNGVPQSFLSAHDHATFGLVPGAGNRRENEENRRLLESLVNQPGAAENDNASFLKHTLMDSLVTEKKVQKVLGDYRPTASYPANPFAASLRNVAALVASGLPTRVYFVSLSGFDTHSNQANQQANLLTTLSTGLAAFQQDLEAHRLDGQVTTMTFSEFGRRPSENESRGTDHGTAAPLFVMGSRVKGGLHGTAASLNLAHNQDLTFSTDFRSVYATMLDRWMGCPSEKVLGGKFADLAIV